jgi:3-hydroxy acid dehydrogenase / malonic semialdehyde reductase
MAYNRVCDFLLPVIIRSQTSVTAEDIAEEIAWAAARPPHVNIAEVFVLPANQASATQISRRGSK